MMLLLLLPRQEVMLDVLAPYRCDEPDCHLCEVLCQLGEF